jgi:S-formylglutathione hydrolase
MAAALEQLSSNKMFGGRNLRFRHQSATLGCPMTFSVYLPPSPASSIPVSVQHPSPPRFCRG